MNRTDRIDNFRKISLAFWRLLGNQIFCFLSSESLNSFASDFVIQKALKVCYFMKLDYRSCLKSVT